MAGQGRLLDSCDALIQSVSERNPEGLGKELQRAAAAATRSKPEHVNAAVAKLLPVLETIQFGPGGDLAKLTGALTDFGTDVTMALPVLVRRACEAMELAARLMSLYADAAAGGSGDGAADKLPDPESPEQYEPTVRWLTGGPAQLPEEQAHELAQAWFAGGSWVHPVMYLCQRKDVRAALPDRERLTAAVSATADHIGSAYWLQGLLEVLDDAPLIAVHRPTGRGYKLTISGIGNNAQLRTLLASTLIGSQRRGLLPGKKPSRAEVAAATESVELKPRGGITGRLSLADGTGRPIPNEGRPADIPLVRDTRVIVLDSPADPPNWEAGRGYPLMKPEITLQRHLPPDEAAQWLTPASPASPASPATE